MLSFSRCQQKPAKGHRTTGSSMKTASPSGARTPDFSQSTVPRSRQRQFGSSTSAEYYTPRHIIELVRSFYGGVIDLDAASCEEANRTVGARHFHDRDGQNQRWFGKVWCNPPGGLEKDLSSTAGSFVQAAITKTGSECTECLLLLRAAFTSQWFKPCLNYPFGICKEAIQFDVPRLPDDVRAPVGRSPFDYALIYFGSRVDEFCSVFSSICFIPGVSCWSQHYPLPV